MDLRTSASPWGRRLSNGLSRGPLERDESCDVLVVGSGISGAMAAYHLARDGADVVIVDKRPLATGSTLGSTALIQYEIDVPLVDLIPRLGLADAQAVYRTTRNALDDLRDLVNDNGLDCDLTQRPTLYLARKPDDALHLKHEALARGQIGIDAAYVDAAALDHDYHIRRPGAVKSSVSYELDPEKLTMHLLGAAAELGARLYERTAMSPEPWVGTTPAPRTVDGHAIVCKRIVYATGYETPAQFPFLKSLCTLSSTYALATKPLDPQRLWPERALLWELASPYFYARTTADNRILVGGEDDDATPDEREARLPAKVERLLAELSATTDIDGLSADRSWAATFASTEDGLPLIGTPAGATGCFFTLGFGGNGILFALLGAQIARDAFAGRHNSAARLFGFDRADTPSVRSPAASAG